MIERKSVIKFLESILAKNLTWRGHINTTKTKIAKGIGLHCKRNHYLENICIKHILHHFVLHTYLLRLY